MGRFPFLLWPDTIRMGRITSDMEGTEWYNAVAYEYKPFKKYVFRAKQLCVEIAKTSKFQKLR